MKIKIKVKPGSKKQEIINDGKKYLVYLKNRAEDGKANLELLKLLKKYFHKDIKIIKGKKSRDKIIKAE